MNTISQASDTPADPSSHVPLIAAREVVRKEPRKLEVPEGAELRLCPSDSDLAGSFFRTQIQSYADLQVLGFAPRRLSEEKVRQAIAEDDKEVFNLVSAGMHVNRPCGCGGGAGEDHATRPSRATPLRVAYNATRKAHNPALARVMSDHFGTTLDWDTPAVGTVRKWALSVKLRPTIVGVLLEDIVIHRNATLTVAAASKLLLAHDIFIHRSGTLAQQGGYLKLWANSINRFLDFVRADSITQVKKTTASWMLND